LVKRRKKRISRTSFDFGKFSRGVKPGLKLGGFWLLFVFVLFIAREFWIGWQYSIWDGTGHFSFAYESNGQVGYISVNQELEEVTILNFPDDLKMPLAYGYGEYRVDKIKRKKHTQYEYLIC